MNTDLFWHLANARYQMYENRVLTGRVIPTGDPILDGNRFTNTFRASDRVSQRMIQIQRDGPQDPDSLLLRTLLFKVFNRESTWDAIVDALGEPTADNWDPEKVKAVLDDVVATNTAVFTSAYLMVTSKLQGMSKHHFYTDMIDIAVTELRDTLLSAPSLDSLVTRLQSLSGVGPFLSYQFAIDLNYSPLFNFSENDHVVVGPGSKRGLEKLFGDARMAPTKITQLWEERERGPLLMGERPMHKIDVQNMLCEYDKYTRAQADEPGKRMKQRYRPDPRPFPAPVWPASWNM